MKEIPIRQEHLSYPASLLENWRRGDYSIIPDTVPRPLKHLIVEKARKRPGRRYFGEMFVLHQRAYNLSKACYTSYKWLTAMKWSQPNLRTKLERMFYDDLTGHFGEKAIRQLQYHARDFFQKHGIKPEAPDLWLIHKDLSSSFVEVKMPGDRIRPGQVEGLALIKKHLETEVGIIMLHPESYSIEKANR